MTARATARPALRPVLAALATATLVVVPALRHRRRSRHHPRWKAVTVLGTAEGLRRQPLDALSGVEVRVVTAPGDRGVEVHARYRRPHGHAADLALRTALRDTKQLTETGGVLHIDPRPHGRRRRTLPGLLQDRIERNAKGLGLL